MIQPIRAQLEHSLQQCFDGARLAEATLSACPEICLWLTDPACLQRRLSEQEQLAIAANPAYWSVCWPGGLALARLILDQPERVKDKTVMDVGCGAGVVAIAAALAGASQVIACDLDPLALQASELNAISNEVELNYCLDYRDYKNVDLICAADLLYDDSNKDLLDDFQQMAKQVLLAESRAPVVDHPYYHLVGEGRYPTEPDQGQTDFFEKVMLYCNRAD